MNTILHHVVILPAAGWRILFNGALCIESSPSHFLLFQFIPQTLILWEFRICVKNGVAGKNPFSVEIKKKSSRQFLLSSLYSQTTPSMGKSNLFHRWSCGKYSLCAECPNILFHYKSLSENCKQEDKQIVHCHQLFSKNKNQVMLQDLLGLKHWFNSYI